MSLGGGANQAVDDAVRNSAASGVFYSLSAGNSSTDACTQSPARAGMTNGIMTVAAIDSASREASFSNYGPCVDIWAPGVSILSTWTGGGYNDNLRHVDGIAARDRRRRALPVDVQHDARRASRPRSRALQ